VYLIEAKIMEGKMAKARTDNRRKVMKELKKLPSFRIQEVLDFIGYLKTKSKAKIVESFPAEVSGRSSLEELEKEFRTSYPDLPFVPELLEFVGGVPDDGKEIDELILDYYGLEREKS
jgi:hypothetical protein